MEKMKEGIDFAHAYGVKVYVTANIYAHNADFEGMADYFKQVEKIGADAVFNFRFRCIFCSKRGSS